MLLVTTSLRSLTAERMTGRCMPPRSINRRDHHHTIGQHRDREGVSGAEALEFSLATTTLICSSTRPPRPAIQQ